MIVPKFRAEVIHGKIRLVDPLPFKNYLYSLEGKPVWLTIQDEKRTKTLPQLRYVHGVVFPLIAQSTGHRPDEIKELMKLKFFSQVVDFKGHRIRINRSLADATIQEMTEFIENCVALALDWGIIIPEADSVEV